ncbi:glucooligosaccharide oxidase [Colletotrichum incanum]|uniref:Glucooligosaccharide oxidase n=1 Tax=Colletotrichum incanum TaxID=1573173 RepID=A0A161Y7P3_COLIC|nr:glucooligosaccharide oxidase [Colletotrichum incanum]OHW96834.1 glucooligosaccharide oxidase [Colletotrichum incanum]
MFPSTLIILVALVSVTFASVLSKRDVIDDCLAAAKVPYNTHNSSQWKADASPFNVRIPFVPASIAVPLTTEHIQAAVKCGRDNGVKVTPKCGGHSYANFGFGGEDGHLMLELDHMYNVTVDNHTGIATVQAGSRLGHIVTELHKQGNKAFSHGTCPGVGIAGHILHGGFGMSSFTKGLALDWLVGAKVVLANSTVVTVSEKEHSDLFWALKGAGSSLGVVSEFHIQTYDEPKQVTSLTITLPWNATQAVEGFRNLQTWADTSMPKELNLRLSISTFGTNLEGNFYGNREGLKTVIEPLVEMLGGRYTSETTDWLGNVQHFANMPLDQTNEYKYVSYVPGPLTSFHPNADMAMQQENFYSNSLYSDKLSDSQIESFVRYWFTTGRSLGRYWWIQVDFHGGKKSAIAERNANSSSYAYRGKFFLYQFYDLVNLSAKYPKDGFSFLQGFIETITNGTQLDKQAKYFNYPDTTLGQNEAQAMYWGENLAKLQQIKAAVDKDEVFYFPQSVRPTSLAGV